LHFEVEMSKSWLGQSWSLAAEKKFGAYTRPAVTPALAEVLLHRALVRNPALAYDCCGSTALKALAVA
jgi:hypothetical protein